MQSIRVKSLGKGDYEIVAIGKRVDNQGLLTAGDAQGITVQTDGDRPVSAEFGRTLWRDIAVTPQMMENELYTMKGFLFSVSEAKKGIWLGLRFSDQKPRSSEAVGLIIDGKKAPGAYPSQYIGCDVMVPEKPGRYHVYIDLTWPDGTPGKPSIFPSPSGRGKSLRNPLWAPGNAPTRLWLMITPLSAVNSASTETILTP